MNYKRLENNVPFINERMFSGFNYYFEVIFISKTICNIIKIVKKNFIDEGNIVPETFDIQLKYSLIYFL